jgi:hypothetical protein
MYLYVAAGHAGPVTLRLVHAADFLIKLVDHFRPCSFDSGVNCWNHTTLPGSRKRVTSSVAALKIHLALVRQLAAFYVMAKAWVVMVAYGYGCLQHTGFII